MGELVGLVAVVCIFGWPIIGMFLKHQQKMAEMRMGPGGQANANLLEEIQEIKRQMAELRDTTTRYDMSFDSALQRMESRMGHVERGLEETRSQAAIAGRD